MSAARPLPAMPVPAGGSMSKGDTPWRSRSEEHPERKFRVHQWIDTKTLEPLFGIQHNVTYGKWAHVVVDDKPALFKTREEALERIKLWSQPVQP